MAVMAGVSKTRAPEIFEITFKIYHELYSMSLPCVKSTMTTILSFWSEAYAQQWDVNKTWSGDERIQAACWDVL